MSDLVATCPKGFWDEWLAEGDAAGSEPTGALYEWQTRSPVARQARKGDRFYIVAHDRLRGWAPILLVRELGDGSYCIIRGANAVACTIPVKVPGFRGLRLRWWNWDIETEFRYWKQP